MRHSSSGPHLVHVFPTFAVGGAQMIAVRLINRLGTDCRHTIISLDGRFEAAERIDGLAVTLRPGPDRPGPGAAWRTLGVLDPDLLLTCNWGSFDWVIASAFRPGIRHLHQEHGFGLDEAHRRHWRRNVFRRFFLTFCDGLIVPSATLDMIASEEWRVAPAKRFHIANGVDREALLREASAVERSNSVCVIGTVAPLRPEKRLDRLIEAFAWLTAQDPMPKLQLVIVGDGVTRPALEAQATALGLDDQVVFRGYRSAPAREIAGFDIYAITSETEQMPVSVLHAMALGVPVVGFDAGDIKHMVADANQAHIVDGGDCVGLQNALRALTMDRDLRIDIGRLNQARQQAVFDEGMMVDRYRGLLERWL